jgi:hypothetical protein
MNIKVITDIDSLKALTAKYPEASQKARLSRITEALQLLLGAVKMKTPEGASPFHLRDRIFEKVEMGEPVIGLLATPPIQYGVPLEYGTKPHGVSIEGQKNLLLWVEKKMGCSGKEAVKIMKAITWKIYHHGTKGAHMFEEGFTENETKIIRILEKIPKDIVK